MFNARNILLFPLIQYNSRCIFNWIYKTTIKYQIELLLTVFTIIFFYFHHVKEHFTEVYVS